MSHSNIFCETIGYDATSGRFCVGGNDVEVSIANVFDTPCYAYSLDNIVQSYRAVRDAYAALHPNVSIHYSLKANANFTIVKRLVQEGCGIDCVSAGEVFKALRCGCPPDHIVFAGVGKGPAEISFAAQQGVGWFNVENELELSYLNEHAATTGRQIRIALRLNPDVAANTHPNIATGHGGAKFGLSVETVQRILSEGSARYPHLLFHGLHVHIGSQLGDTTATQRAVQIALSVVAGHPHVVCLNIGGGMPVSYDGRVMPDPGQFAANICPLVQSYHLMLEPGRSIVASSGVLLTRVLYRKDQAGQKMLIVDASMTDLMRPALYGAKHAVLPVQQVTDADAAASETFMVVGPVCETTDVLASNVVLPTRCSAPGQLLILMTVGAYGFAMANQYNARPLIPQVVVTEGRVHLSTKRQTFEDLIRDELDA